MVTWVVQWGFGWSIGSDDPALIRGPWIVVTLAGCGSLDHRRGGGGCEGSPVEGGCGWVHRLGRTEGEIGSNDIVVDKMAQFGV